MGLDTTPSPADRCRRWPANHVPVATVSYRRRLTSSRPLFEAYRNRRAKDDEAADRAVVKPEITQVDDLYDLVTLTSVDVHCLSRLGIPYVGLEFSCPWDHEHGVGVLTHGTRIVEVGEADTANLLWIAQQDAEAMQGDAST